MGLWPATPSPLTSLMVLAVGHPSGLVPCSCWQVRRSRRLARTSTSSLVLGKHSREPLTRRSELRLLFSFLLGFGLSIASTSPYSYDALCTHAVTLILANAAAMLVPEVSYPLYRPQLSSLYNTLWYSVNIMYVIGSHEEAFISLISAFCTVLPGLRSALLASRATGPGVSPPSSRLSLLSSSSS